VIGVGEGIAVSGNGFGVETTRDLAPHPALDSDLGKFCGSGDTALAIRQYLRIRKVTLFHLCALGTAATVLHRPFYFSPTSKLRHSADEARVRMTSPK
jgi:hypothetical protein